MGTAGAPDGEQRNRAGPVFDPGFVVALRTHKWTPEIAEAAARLQAMADGTRFVVLADVTGGMPPIERFETIAHTNDFTEFGLPGFPENQVLWYNADYPLYLLARLFPQASHYVMIEYDVGVSVRLLPIMAAAAAERIDLIAHYIHAADADWEWRAPAAAHFTKVFQAFLPFMVVSARAVRHLLARRRASRRTDLRSFADWPFCEAFIPSALFEMTDMRSAELSRFADLTHYTLDCVLHPDHPWARRPGSIAHKIGVSPNLALGKPATQSSLHPWWQAKSREDDAARGNNGRRGRAEGFNTAAEDEPWWQVDLLAAHEVRRLVIHDRVDAPTQGLRLKVATSLDAQNWRTQAEFALQTALPVSFPHPVQARHIRITRSGYGELHLDEIEVY